MSVRLPSAESYASQVPKEQKWLPFLGDRLSILIPRSRAFGKPGHGYPWSWSVYEWIEGEDVELNNQADIKGLSKSVALFIAELHTVDPLDGPKPGLHNYLRGAGLSEYDKDTRAFIDLLSKEICTDAVLSVWNSALETRWKFCPVWVHGDLEPSNLLVVDGKLTAVIDFGNCAVGDPACDLVMAWTFFDDDARENFRSNLNLDSDTWQRGRAWALWKALFRMSRSLDLRDTEFHEAKRLVGSIVSSSQ